MKHKMGGLLSVLLWTLTACQSTSILRGSSQEQAFRERYVQKPFYTAVFIHPYRYNEDYLIDLTGTVAELDTETPRAPVTVRLLDDEGALLRRLAAAPLRRGLLHVAARPAPQRPPHRTARDPARDRHDGGGRGRGA